MQYYTPNERIENSILTLLSRMTSPTKAIHDFLCIYQWFQNPVTSAIFNPLLLNDNTFPMLAHFAWYLLYHSLSYRSNLIHLGVSTPCCSFCEHLISSQASFMVLSTYSRYLDLDSWILQAFFIWAFLLGHDSSAWLFQNAN